MKTDRIRYLEVVAIVLVLLYVGRALFIPLSFALLISFVSYPLCRYLEKRRWPRSLAITVCLLGFIVFIAIITQVLVTGIIQLTDNWETISRQFQNMFGQLAEFVTEQFNISRQQQTRYLESSGRSAMSSVGDILASLLTFSATSIAMLIIIPVFVALILANREILAAALLAALPAERRPMASEVLHESVTTYYEFVKGMAIIYALVGVLNSMGLALLGIPDFLFFGFLASVLTFIPYVGILIGGAVPVAIAWGDSPAKALAVIAVFVVVQYLEANIIFPRAVGQRLKINTLIMLISIIAGGILWGGAGIVIIPPLIGILKIIADRVEEWKPLGILLDTEPPKPEF